MMFTRLKLILLTAIPTGAAAIMCLIWLRRRLKPLPPPPVKNQSASKLTDLKKSESNKINKGNPKSIVEQTDRKSPDIKSDSNENNKDPITTAIVFDEKPVKKSEIGVSDDKRGLTKVGIPCAIKEISFESKISRDQASVTGVSCATDAAVAHNLQDVLGPRTDAWNEKQSDSCMAPVGVKYMAKEGSEDCTEKTQFLMDCHNDKTNDVFNSTEKSEISLASDDNKDVSLASLDPAILSMSSSVLKSSDDRRTSQYNGAKDDFEGRRDERNEMKVVSVFGMLDFNI